MYQMVNIKQSKILNFDMFILQSKEEQFRIRLKHLQLFDSGAASMLDDSQQGKPLGSVDAYGCWRSVVGSHNYDQSLSNRQPYF